MTASVEKKHISGTYDTFLHATSASGKPVKIRVESLGKGGLYRFETSIRPVLFAEDGAKSAVLQTLSRERDSDGGVHTTFNVVRLAETAGQLKAAFEASKTVYPGTNVLFGAIKHARALGVI